jgi:hypothetical protein
MNASKHQAAIKVVLSSAIALFVAGYLLQVLHLA